ncbi:uncharacterized protein B0T23DRAFT_369843, partial [Neurospora hispaniola]
MKNHHHHHHLKPKPIISQVDESMVLEDGDGSRLVRWTGFDTVCLGRPTLPLFPRRVGHRKDQDADSAK